MKTYKPMKNYILIFVLFLSFAACSNNDGKGNQRQQQTLFGTWKLIEIYGSDGGGMLQWNPVQDGYNYTFKENGVLLSNRFSCNGSYSLENDNHTSINFDCNVSKFTQTYDYHFENNRLILEPHPNPCDEGCMEKYKKIK